MHRGLALRAARLLSSEIFRAELAKVPTTRKFLSSVFYWCAVLAEEKSEELKTTLDNWVDVLGSRRCRGCGAVDVNLTIRKKTRDDSEYYYIDCPNCYWKNHQLDLEDL